MKKKTKKQNKLCAILDLVAAILFTLSGITIIMTDGLQTMLGIVGIALGVTFGSLTYIYYKKYKEEK